MCPCHGEKEAGGRVDLCDGCLAAGCTETECKRLRNLEAPPDPVDPPAESS